MLENEVYIALRDFEFTQDAVIATQVYASGSLPRKDYPSLVVFNDGRTFGTVGGGAMESDVINKAQSLLGTEHSELVEFDLASKNIRRNAGVCGGSNKVLFEPVSRMIRDFWLELNQKNKKSSEIVVVIDIEENKTLKLNKYIFPNSEESEKADLHKNIKQNISSAFKQKKSIQYSEPDRTTLINYLKKNLNLHIFGAGHVGKAVYELARFVEYDVNIYDDRSDLANYNRFPQANNIYSGSVQSYPEELYLRPEDFVLIATRGHQHDYEILKWLLTLDLAYIGMLCSSRKLKMINRELEKDGIEISNVKNLFAPVGLDINSDTVPEIAVSIVAEIIDYHKRGTASRITLSQVTREK